jgi:beta-glucosidase
VRASVDLSNTGPRAGTEVVQLYVGYEGSRVERAVRELKAFTRVELEPGETKTVELEVPAAKLAYWDVERGAFIVEPIAYQLSVGGSSRDLPVTTTFEVAAE